MKKTVPFLLLIVFFAAAAWYSLTRDTEPVDELPPSIVLPETPLDDQAPAPLPDEEALEAESAPVVEPLPELNDSDADIKQALQSLADNGELAQYLVRDQLVSRFVAVIDALDSRQVPPPIIPVSHPEGKFLVTPVAEKTVLDARNFDRYTAYTGLLQALDNDAVLGFYSRYYPLIQQAWEENGGEGTFNDRLLAVIDHLLTTPSVDGDIFLVKPEAVYLFVDPELEALSAGQKILLRMGPDNMAVVKVKLAEIKDILSSEFAYF